MGKIVSKTCERCKNSFEVIWKNRHQKFCCRDCMYEWRKDKNWTTSICLHCKKLFLHRKKERRLFCSNICNRVSDYKKDKLRKWIKDNNPMNNPESVKKISNSLKGRNIGFGAKNKKCIHTDKSKNKMSRVATKNYKNNKEEILTKRNETYLEKYGVTNREWLIKLHRDFCEKNNIRNTYQLPRLKRKSKSRISQGQLRLYATIKKRHPDAILEHWLSDVKRYVDIYIPSKNQVIEFHGYYWHCNPKKYKEDYYNAMVKMTAQQIWDRDAKRQQELSDAGYNVVVEWEN